jgi:hypothetical protein
MKRLGEVLLEGLLAGIIAGLILISYVRGC